MMHETHKTKTQSGFTLIEMIIVIAMIVIVAWVIKGCFFDGGSKKHREEFRSSGDGMVYHLPLQNACGVHLGA